MGFERELYSGQIRNDTDLWNRARVRGISLDVRDDKCKISGQEGILMGEVSETDGAVFRTRRLFVSCGAYAIIDITEAGPVLHTRGEGSTFVVLGNEVTKRIAHEMIRAEWENGTFADAVRLVIRIMNTAASCTASVSRECALLQTRTKADLDRAPLLAWKTG